MLAQGKRNCIGDCDPIAFGEMRSIWGLGMSDFEQDETGGATAPGLTLLTLRIVAILGLVWSGFGIFDYLMTNMRDLDYLSGLDPKAIQSLDALDYDIIAGWTISVGGVLLGSLLLLARSRFAQHAFALSLIGFAYAYFSQTGLDLPKGKLIFGMPAGSAIGWIVAILLLFYSIRCGLRGLLR